MRYPKDFLDRESSKQLRALSGFKLPELFQSDPDLPILRPRVLAERLALPKTVQHAKNCMGRASFEYLR